ncbi:MAG: ABC transporter ATP-binding protein, partial [Bacteroidetes bacterium]|nr:ABC transporter ATP-binding protein [Bacteroidota bacterium]
ISLNDINQVALALFLLFGFQSLFSFLRVVLFNNVTENALRDLRNDAFQRLIYMPIDFFNENKVGELSSRISSDITQIQETLRTTIAELFRQLIMIFGGVIFLLFISWKLALIMLATVPVMAIIAVFFGRYIRKLSKKAQDFTAESNGIIEEALTGISIVKTFTNEFFILSKYKKATQETRDLNVKSGIWRGLFVSFIIFCLFGAIVFIVWQGLLMTQGNNPELSAEGFYQFVLFTIMMGASVGSLPDLYASFQKAVGSTEKLMELIQNDTEREQSHGVNKPVLSGSIEMKGIQFSYPQRPEITVIQNLSLKIKENQTVALVGSSGAGKSTLSNLLLRFYPLQGGQIEVNGIPIEEIELQYYRENIGVVPQEVILFSGNIRDNILFGKPSASDEEVVFAAQQANAWEFISSFPGGLDTQVGDRGIQLSGGQKQRIAIARAILKNPAILILDEATSALDSESERLVQEALDTLMKGRTCIVIAHRLSTIRNADNIFVLQRGEIIESGKHQELIRKKGVYADFVALQSMKES